MPLRRLTTTRRRINKAIRLALNEIGRRLVAQLRETCSVRVQYLPGGDVIRSDPDEPPRKEYGDLVKSFKYRVKPKAEDVSALIVFTNYEVAAYLEYGTRYIDPRPFWWVSIRQAGNLNTEFKKWFKYYYNQVNAAENFQDPNWVFEE